MRNARLEGVPSPRTLLLVWGAAVALFVVGDVLTTAYGLYVAGAVEAHPGSALVLEAYGLPAMLVAKAAMVAVAVWLARQPENGYVALGPAIGLALAGAAITAWNFLVLVLLTAR